LENATFTDRIGAWGASFTGGTYGVTPPDAVFFDGNDGSASFMGAGFPGSQAAFVVRASASTETTVMKRSLLDVMAQGIGTIRVTMSGSRFDLSLTLA
jgi:hypothetical protein